jgi:REP element-mobilizing transposase RayT
MIVAVMKKAGRRVIAFHVALSAYGFWLPNDPRGSGSWYVGSASLYEKHGPATHVAGEQSVAGRPHDVRARRAAKRDLKYPPVRFTGVQALCIAKGFGEVAGRDGLVIHACAILPDHVHLVIARHARLSVELIMTKLKIEASRRLREQGLHPFQNQPEPDGNLPKIWARDGRHRFLWTPEQVFDRIAYVNQNPVKHGFKPQHWYFVLPFRPHRG